MRRLSGAFAYFAMLCTCSLAYGQPGFGQSDPAYGSAYFECDTLSVSI